MAKTNFQTIPEYIRTFPKNVQLRLRKIRETIVTSVPGAEETISYQIPTIKLNGKYVVYFAAHKNHIGIYPFSPAMEKMIKESAAYKTSGKGTIQFPHDKPLPLSLIRKIVKYRLSEVLEGTKKNKK